MTHDPTPEPRPLARLHPATLLIEIPGSLRGFILPLVMVLVFTGSWDRVERSLAYAAAFIALGAIVTVFRYFTLRFGIRGDRLVIQSGLLQRSHRTIPLDQIQNVDLRRGLVHRWFRVCDVRIETAGSAEAEAHLSVVADAIATDLRDELLRARSGTSPPATPGDAATASHDPAAPTPSAMPAETVIRAASVRDLVVAGATETRVGAFLAFLLATAENLREGGFDLSTWLDQRFAAVLGDGPLATGLVFSALAVVFLAIGWTASIVLSVVRWFGFKLLSTEHGLRRRFGLLTQFEALLRRERIQLVLLEANPLRRALGLTAMKVQTAGSAKDAESSGSTLLAPLLPVAEVDGVLRHVFDRVTFDDARLARVHPKARRRGFVRACGFLGAFVVAPCAALAPAELAGAVALCCIVLAATIAHARYRALGYALFDDHLVARGGVWTRRWWIVPKDRVQTLVLAQSPTQRWAGLATLVVDTAGAAGHSVARVVDLDLATARSVYDDLLENAARTSWGGGLVRADRAATPAPAGSASQAAPGAP